MLLLPTKGNHKSVKGYETINNLEMQTNLTFHRKRRSAIRQSKTEARMYELILKPCCFLSSESSICAFNANEMTEDNTN